MCCKYRLPSTYPPAPKVSDSALIEYYFITTTVKPQLTVTSLQRTPLCNGHFFFVLGEDPHISSYFDSLKRPPLYNSSIISS